VLALDVEVSGGFYGYVWPIRLGLSLFDSLSLRSNEILYGITVKLT